jgi:hypothetical protein
MDRFTAYCALAFAVALAGCSGSAPEERTAPTAASAPPVVLTDTLSDLSAALPGQTQDDEILDQALLESASPWTPRYVPTGLASGVMLEFTGVKKGKTLNAKVANIELRRYLHDTVAAPAGGPLPALSGPMRTQAPINNLHQAFFKVQPGTYFLRVTNPWADRKVMRGVVVREGEYSVLSNDVYAAWLKRSRQRPDSTGTRVQE